MEKYNVTVMPKRNESINVSTGIEGVGVNLNTSQRWTARLIQTDEDNVLYEVYHKKRGIFLTMSPLSFEQFFVEITRKGE